MLTWFKNKKNDIKEYFDVKKNTDFNFENYIKSTGFRFISEKNDLKLYVNNYDGIKINLIINLSKKEVLIGSGGNILTRINFIPSGSLFSDMIINQTVNGVKELYVQEQ